MAFAIYSTIVRRYNTMASLSFSQEDSQLIAELHSLHKRSSKLVNSEYDRPAPPDAEVTVENQRMNKINKHQQNKLGIVALAYSTIDCANYACL